MDLPSIYHKYSPRLNQLAAIKSACFRRMVSRFRRLRLLFNKAYHSFKSILYVLFVLVFWYSPSTDDFVKSWVGVASPCPSPRGASVYGFGFGVLGSGFDCSSTRPTTLSSPSSVSFVLVCWYSSGLFHTVESDTDLHLTFTEIGRRSFWAKLDEGQLNFIMKFIESRNLVR